MPPEETSPLPPPAYILGILLIAASGWSLSQYGMQFRRHAPYLPTLIPGLLANCCYLTGGILLLARRAGALHLNIAGVILSLAVMVFWLIRIPALAVRDGATGLVLSAAAWPALHVAILVYIASLYRKKIIR